MILVSFYIVGFSLTLSILAYKVGFDCFEEIMVGLTVSAAWPLVLPIIILSNLLEMCIAMVSYVYKKAKTYYDDYGY